MPLDFQQERSSEAAGARLVHGYDISVPSNVYVHRVPLGTTSIAEGIDDELTSFHATLIQAPTGFGKTHFILHEVLPRVLQEGGRMLLVSNRVAVSYQQKKEVMELTNPSEIRWLTPEGILQKTDFGPVKIMTLQALDMFLASQEGKDYAKEVSVLVVDEVHYFTSDVPFNPNAARLLKILPQRFSQAVRIYMTATPDDVLWPLAQAEAHVQRPLLERSGVLFSPLMLGQAPGVNWYQFTSDKYSHLPVRYYRKDDELYPEIRRHDKDKWMIFVSSKECGLTMQKELGDDVVFLSAESKGSPQWNQLLSEKRCASRILIATSVLDCGVNLWDAGIKHVVVPYEDPTTFMQALGRVRFQGTPGFTLYVKALGTKRLNGLIYQNRQLLSLANEIQEHKCLNRYVDRFRLEQDWAKSSLLYLDYNGRFMLNKLYQHKLRRQMQCYQQLMEAINQYGDSAFPRLVHQWLGQPDAYDERNWIQESARQTAERQLPELIDKYNGVPLSNESKQQEFARNLAACYSGIMGKEKRIDRNNGKYGLVQLNHMLDELKVRGKINKIGEKGSEIWILQTEDGTCLRSETGGGCGKQDDHGGGGSPES